MKLLTVPRVISLMTRSESPSFLYCIAFFSACFAVMGVLRELVLTTSFRLLLLPVTFDNGCIEWRVRLSQEMMPFVANVADVAICVTVASSSRGLRVLNSVDKTSGLITTKPSVEILTPLQNSYNNPLLLIYFRKYPQFNW